ncbi:MAG: Repeat family, partial [Capsulimonas sp.]|nr:Repeat family [Capsulimonas sp.]
RPKLEALIYKASAFIFIMSSDSITSSACLDEIAIAENLQKIILPIRYKDGYDDDQIPFALRQPQWIFVPDVREIPAQIDNLVEAINTDFDLAEMHTFLADRSTDWKNKGFPKDRLLLEREDLQNSEAWLLKVDARVAKRPSASDLQREYIRASRAYNTNSSQRRRNIVAGIAIVMLGLTIASIIFGIDATRERNSARTNAFNATMQSVIAEINSGAANQNATYANLQTEEAKKQTKEAKKQRNFAAVQKDKAVASAGAAKRSAIEAKRTLAAQYEEAGRKLLLDQNKPGQMLVSSDDILKALSYLTEAYSLASTVGKVTPSLRFLLTWGAYRTKGLTLALPAAHTRGIQEALFSPNGHRILTCGMDGTGRIWDLQGNLLHTLDDNVVSGGYTDHIESGLFSRDGQMVALNSFLLLGEDGDHSGSVWRASDGRLLPTTLFQSAEDPMTLFQSTEKPIGALQQVGVSKIVVDAGRVFVNRNRSNVRLLPLLFSTSPSESTSAAFDPSGRMVVVASNEHRYATVWNWADAAPPFKRFTGVVAANHNFVLYWRANRGYLYSLSKASTSVFPSRFDIPDTAAISDSGRYIFLSRKDVSTSRVKSVIFDLVTRRVVTQFTLDELPFEASFSSNEDRFVAVMGKTIIRITGLSHQCKFGSMKLPDDQASEFYIDPKQGRYVASWAVAGSQDERIQGWDLDRNKLVVDIDTSRISNPCFSPNGDILYAVDRDWIYSWVLGGALHRQKSHQELIPWTRRRAVAPMAISFNNDGSLYATYGGVYVSKSNVRVSEFDTPDHGTQASFSPRNDFVASVDFEGTTRLFNLLDGRLLASMFMPPGVDRAYFDSSGDHLVTLNRNKEAWVWNLRFPWSSPAAVKKWARTVLPYQVVNGSVQLRSAEDHGTVRRVRLHD